MKQLAVFVILVGAVVFGLYFIKNGINVNPAQKQALLKPVDPWQPITPVDPNPKNITPPPGPQEPNVLDAMKPAFKLAQTSNKKVFVMLSTQGCVWCERMKRDVYPNTNMSEYVYLETKDRAVIDNYHATAFPTLIIFDNTGRELKRSVGYMGLSYFRQWLQ